ncbi:MAG: PAS domain-containing protein [Chlamydiia bacterium]|nr:PAS domain-containing protein [Chlamydiia bacterium]
MMSFRKKVLLGDTLLFLFFFFVIFLWIGKDVGIFTFGTLLLFVYTFTTGFIAYRFSFPIQYILDTITPFQEGKAEYLPRISLPNSRSDEFFKLATTLNALSEKIQKQIETLKAQRIETEEILESLAEGVLAVDRSAVITFANQAASQLLKIPREIIVGHSFLNSALHRKCEEMVLQSLQTSEINEQTWNDEEKHLVLFSAPLSRQHKAILVLQDKTVDRKLVDMGKHFIANASHELRTPITILRGFAEVLADAKELTPGLVQEIGEKILKTSHRLEKLVKGLLTLTDIENSSSDHFFSCDLVTIAENCQLLLKTAHPQVEIQWDKQIEKGPLIADADLLEMAIMNLLENAVRYSAKPVRIQMSSGFTLGHYQLIIKDFGIGIPQKDLPHIFNRFYRVDKGRSRKAGGVGLGLSIVKTIVEKHKGKISVESELGNGSQFTLSFPSKDSCAK